MNRYLDKERGAAVEIKRAVLRSPFSVLHPGRGISLLVTLCAFALVFAACDTGAESSDTGSSTSTASRSVDGVTLTVQTKTLIAAETFTVDAELNPPNASNKKVSWSSSDEAVATVVGTGLNAVVTAKGPGTASITVTTADGNRTASCVVDVKSVKSFRVSGYEEFYEPNDEFIYDNITMNVVYTDGTVSSAPIAVQKEWITLPDNWNILSSPGNPQNAASEPHPITVTYGGVKGGFDITLRSVRWVTIIGTPKRSIYNIGEAFDPTGLTLTASYDVGPNKEGIPLTQEILATGTANTPYATWSDAAGYTSAYNYQGSDDSKEIGPFLYKGKWTTDQTTATGGQNLTTLNGEATIKGLTVALFVVKSKVNNVDTYQAFDARVFSTNSVTAFFSRLAGQTATVTTTHTWSSYAPSQGTIAIPANTHIELVAYKNQKMITQTNVANPIFTVAQGGSLKVENFILNTGVSTTVPLVVVNGGEFTLGGNSIMTIPGASGAGVAAATTFSPRGIMAVMSGKATIEEGAVINTLNVSYPLFVGTAGIYVGSGGTLTMNGGIIQGTPIPITNTAVGVGDVVIASGGTLELGGSAWINRLALAASGPVGKPMVNIKANWNPSQSIILNLTADTDTIATVQDYFRGYELFSGSMVGKLSNFAFEAQSTGSITYGGGFFVNGVPTNGTSAPFNPTPIPQGSGNGQWDLSSDGRLTFHQ